MTYNSLAGLRICWDSLDDLLSSLNDDEWSVQSLCPEWSVAGVVIHLIAVEEMLLGRSPNEFSERLPFEEVGASSSAMAGLTPHELLERFRSVTAQRWDELSNLSSSAFETAVMTPVGPGTYGRFMEIRVFDFWVHEQDIRTPLQRPGHEGGIAAERSIDEIRMSMPYIAGKKVGVPDGSSLRVVLTGPVESTITTRVTGRAALTDDRDPVDATLMTDSTTFALLACGRVDPQSRIDSGAIKWSGDGTLGERAANNLRFTM